jgi:uncharacterized membrane protein
VPSSLALALAGLGVSVYLTIEHFRAPGTLACPATATVNCAQVTTSAQSHFLGMPVAVLGLAYFVVALVLCLPQVWALRDQRVWKARLGVAGLGLLFVIWLIFAELFLIKAICLWCTAVHLIAFGLFAVVVMATAKSDLGFSDR